MGQPLSLAVEVRVDSPDDAVAQCFRADVFHGDAAVEASRVRIIVQAPGAGSQDAVIRIRSSAVVDEPVIGVVLHALCGQRGERRYDFLPEYPAELVAAQVPVARPTEAPASVPFAAPDSAATAPVAPTPLPVPAPAPAPRPAAAAPPAVVRAPAAAPRPAQARPPAQRPAPRAVAAAPRPAAPKAEAPAKAAEPAVAAAPTEGRPRLTLDAPLRSITALAGPPAENPPERAQAVNAWRALNAQPGDMQVIDRMLAMEAQAKAAQDARDKSERDLRARLERAERRLDEADNNRVDIALVYGLLALLLLTIAAAAYFWHRARRNALAAANWVQEPASVVVRPSRSADFSPSSIPPEPVEVQQERPPTPAGAGLDKWATAAGLGAPVTAAQAARPVPVEAGASEGAVPAPAPPSRSINPEEFFDVQQHADFFVSLGQYDQAIEVLKKHIEEQAEMSPLAFLELFKIYHTLGRQGEYNALREEFQRTFNGRVPNFAAFADEGLGLEDYPVPLMSIETAWGETRVLDTIEANIFRHPEDTGRPLDLAAFRDLLLLYAIAKTVLRTGEDGVAPDSTGNPTWRTGLAQDSAFQPRRLTRPDFTASLTPAGAGLAAASVAPAALELDSGPAPLSSPNYDHGLVLDLDLSTTNLAPMDATPAPREVPLPELDIDLGLDIDLQLLDMESGPATLPPPDAQTPALAPMPAPPDAGSNKPVVDSGLVDFDLFDPGTEARIAPKSTR
ncbi:FimV family protein [Pseudorhodoferax sp. Leaf267]|uniref:type IV pilus assembly protein FimV n=1 Tax=Pseudorhodoferax sp. Leaf267 TaxID=1736316 RepID=UPI000712515A|nr:hypothetical protein [Pseudorhodoferax sp. Leaf267]KQP20018.1 hypothetical protein ASF43_28055 [Pseudorhodoferax sp. Leaf267]